MHDYLPRLVMLRPWIRPNFGHRSSRDIQLRRLDADVLACQGEAFTNTPQIPLPRQTFVLLRFWTARSVVCNNWRHMGVQGSVVTQHFAS